MADFMQTLNAEGGGESAGFLNTMIALLWPNICVAGSQIVKEAVEPMFKSMLPGPLSSLHFTRLDFGTVPIQLSKVKTTRSELHGIKLELQVDWDGKCDVELDAGALVPGLGVENVHLHGRLTVLLCPLINTIPLIQAAQIAFVNPPDLVLDFTGAANVADFSVIDGAVRSAILGVINSMFTLPNRFLIKMDANADYFQSYHYPLGIVRITVEKAWGFAEEAKSSTKKLFNKLTRAEPDCYAAVTVGAEERWKTKTKSNTAHPSWNETKDFVVSDFDQCIKVDVEDEDVGSDDEVGIAVTTVRELLLAGSSQELPLVRKGQETEGRVSISASYYKFEASGNSFSSSEHKADGKLCGIATILVAGAYDIPGQRQELKPSVIVTWGAHRFQTGIQSDAPGMDMNNPAFDQNFRVPVTLEMVGKKAENVRIALMNGEKEMGAADVAFADVLNAPSMTLQQKFDVGNGATVRASICLRGISAASVEQEALPERTR